MVVVVSSSDRRERVTQGLRTVAVQLLLVAGKGRRCRYLQRPRCVYRQGCWHAIQGRGGEAILRAKKAKKVTACRCPKSGGWRMTTGQWPLPACGFQRTHLQLACHLGALNALKASPASTAATPPLLPCTVVPAACGEPPNDVIGVRFLSSGLAKLAQPPTLALGRTDGLRPPWGCCQLANRYSKWVPEGTCACYRRGRRSDLRSVDAYMPTEDARPDDRHNRRQWKSSSEGTDKKKKEEEKNRRHRGRID